MTKHRTKRPIPDPSISALTPASTRQMFLPRAVLDTRIALREFLLAAGMKALLDELEDDRTLLCGPKGRFQDDRRAYRHGHDTGQLVMGGRKVRVLKPRVRSVDGGEMELPHWRHFSQEDPLDERVQKQILMGISTRDYKDSLEELPAPLEETGISRYNVSRRFVARTARSVETFLGRPLGEHDFPVLLLDGVEMGEHVLLTALGIVFGVGSVIGMLSIGAGAREQSLQFIERLGVRNILIDSRPVSTQLK